MPQQFAKCINCDSYIYNFRFLQLSGLSLKYELWGGGGDKRPCRQPKFMAFLDPWQGGRHFVTWTS